MQPCFDLLLITDGLPSVVERVAKALEGAPPGRVAVQLRDKAAGAGALLEQARRLRALTRERGCALLINDRVDVALACDADGVHLPETGLSGLEARLLLGPDQLVGVSRHDRAGVERAANECVDYVVLAPVNAVATKNPPLGVRGFAAACAGVDLPVYALGGVKAADVPALRAAGARGVAVMRTVMSAPDPARTIAHLLVELQAR